MKVRYTFKAQSDINDIYTQIAKTNPPAGQDVETAIRIKAGGLMDFPEIGIKTDLEDVRRLPLVRYPYTIFYRINWKDDAIDILRVVSASSLRDLGKVPE